MQLRKVRITQAIAGPSGFQAGEETSLPGPIAKRYVEHGIAEYIDEAEDKKAAPPVKRARKASSRKAKTTEKR